MYVVLSWGVGLMIGRASEARNTFDLSSFGASDGRGRSVRGVGVSDWLYNWLYDLC